MLNCGYIEDYELTEGVDKNVHKKQCVEISSQEVHVVQSVVETLFHTYGSTENCGFTVKNQLVQLNRSDGETQLRQESRIKDKSCNSDEEKGEEEIYLRICSGTRNFRHVLWCQLPFCLMFECRDYQLSPHSRRLDQLQHSLKVNDTTYVLAQVILYNGSHFQGITVVMGKYLFYDGLVQANGLQWVPSNYKWGQRYQPHCIWYKHSNFIEHDTEEDSIKEAEENNSSNIKSKQGKKKSATERALAEYESMKGDDDIQSVERVKGKKESPRRNRKSSTSPMGISVKQVAARSNMPNCQYCRQNIARGKWLQIFF